MAVEGYSVILVCLLAVIFLKRETFENLRFFVILGQGEEKEKEKEKEKREKERG
jgi:hypothetical protein